MRDPVFTGVCPAMITPFTPSGAIYYDKFAALLDLQIAAGVSAICVCGTTGESATLSTREHIELVDFCVKRVGGRVKVLAGSGSNDTSAALYLSRRALDAGADALLLVTPYYNKATQAGLVQHYEYIANRVDLPMILYNVPSRTGISISAATCAQLARHPNIVGIKEASGDLNLATHIRNLCGDDFAIWSGNDDQVVPLMALGAKGVISVAANVIPDVMVKMAALCLAGDFEPAANLQVSYITLMDALFLEVNPIPVKTAMNLMGLDVGGLRLPLCDSSPAGLAALTASLRHMKLIA